MNIPRHAEVRWTAIELEDSRMSYMYICCTTYAADAFAINRTLERSLQFPLTRTMMNIFKTNSK